MKKREDVNPIVLAAVISAIILTLVVVCACEPKRGLPHDDRMRQDAQAAYDRELTEQNLRGKR